MGARTSLRTSRTRMPLARLLPIVFRVHAASTTARISGRLRPAPRAPLASRSARLSSTAASPVSTTRRTTTMATGSLHTGIHLAEGAVPYHFSSAFDSGNGELVSATPETLTVNMRAEPFTEADGRAHIQWFHFRVTSAKNLPLRVVVANAGEASYPDGWHRYKACVSTDRKNWHRVRSTSYDQKTGELVIDFRKEPGGVPGDCVYFAYFVPYSYERHLDLIASAANCPYAKLITLGTTIDGRPLDCLRFGARGSFIPEIAFAGNSPEDAAAAARLETEKTEWQLGGGERKVVWVIGRQHPGESMASWWMEGFIERLLDEEDPVTKKLLRRCAVYVVPNMNPDGAIRGHLRTNANGANLNREWNAPSLEYSPEVFHTRNAMDATTVDLMLDVHGDEAEPYCFIVGGEGTPGWDEERAATQKQFKESYALACPDFQCVFPLEYASAPVGNVVTAKTQVAVRYRSIGLTLEMPFTDNVQLEQKDGWTAKRSRKLGAAALEAILAVAHRLKSSADV